jgi:hypothetical protein
MNAVIARIVVVSPVKLVVDVVDVVDDIVDVADSGNASLLGNVGVTAASTTTNQSNAARWSIRLFRFTRSSECRQLGVDFLCEHVTER